MANWWWTAGACLVLASLVGCGNSSPITDNRADAYQLRVASDLDNPPFAYRDENGEPAGWEVEMVRTIAREIGRRVVWNRLPFEELLDTVARGDADIVCATMGVTPERAERVAFSEPYFRTEIAVVVRNVEGSPTTIAELQGRRVGAGKGTTSERAVRQHLPRSEGVFEADKGRTLNDMLGAGELDAVVMDGPVAARLVLESKGELRQLTDPLTEERYALALSRGRPELLRRIDAAIQNLRDRGIVWQSGNELRVEK